MSAWLTFPHLERWPTSRSWTQKKLVSTNHWILCAGRPPFVETACWKDKSCNSGRLQTLKGCRYKGQTLLWIEKRDWFTCNTASCWLFVLFPVFYWSDSHSATPPRQNIGSFYHQENDPHVPDVGRTWVLEQLPRRHHVAHDFFYTNLFKEVAMLSPERSRVVQDRFHHVQKWAIHAHNCGRRGLHPEQLDCHGLSGSLTVPLNPLSESHRTFFPFVFTLCLDLAHSATMYPLTL